MKNIKSSYVMLLFKRFFLFLLLFFGSSSIFSAFYEEPPVVNTSISSVDQVKITRLTLSGPPALSERVILKGLPHTTSPDQPPELLFIGNVEKTFRDEMGATSPINPPLVVDFDSSGRASISWGGLNLTRVFLVATLYRPSCTDVTTLVTSTPPKEGRICCKTLVATFQHKAAERDFVFHASVVEES